METEKNNPNFTGAPETRNPKFWLDSVEAHINKLASNLMTFPDEEELSRLRVELESIKANSTSWPEAEKSQAEKTIALGEKYLVGLQKRGADRDRLHERDQKLAEIWAKGDDITEEDRERAAAIIKEYADPEDGE